MSNTIGSKVRLTIFGESHGPAIGAVLDGLSPGVKVDEGFIRAQLTRRRPSGATETARVEKDELSILSGVRDGYTTGSPIALVIPNENTRSSDYASFEGIARPSHADFSGHVRYGGFEDPRGGGHFSGRITAGIVAAGAICIDALRSRGITLATHILSCGSVKDSPFSTDASEIDLLDSKTFPVIDDIEDKVIDEIMKAKMDCDSIGGVIQTAVRGVPAGVGDPWFDSLESMISQGVFAIGGIKGIGFGSGFGFASMRGSQANDSFLMQDDRIVTATNHNGGINGGISNGMPIVFDMAVKPTPSISRPQQSVDFINGKDVTLELKGRHDPAIIRRICIVVTSMVAIVLCDALEGRYGDSYFTSER